MNTNLNTAKRAKQDEFYTSWFDIEREMSAYLEFDPDVFRGKTILLPCDDPAQSNFTKFFALHFLDFGLEKLISTSYAPTGNAGRIFTLTPDDIPGGGCVDINDLPWEHLEGDGDFRSPEVTALRDEADMVVTNPPFSLFREFVPWLSAGGVEFSVLGNMNAITYRQIFPLFRANRVWYGPTIGSGNREFRVPDSYPLAVARVDEDGNRFVHINNARWFTNINHGYRNEPQQLMTMAENIKFSKHKKVRGHEYQRYANFEAIEVPFSDAIPSDYDGVMGVPISFLDKYSPDQFEIIGISEGWDNAPSKKFPPQTQIDKRGGSSVVTTLNIAPALRVSGPVEGRTYYIVDGEYYVATYARILIRHRSPAPKMVK